MVAGGHPERAEPVARTITHPDYQAQALRNVTEALVAAEKSATRIGLR